MYLCLDGNVEIKIWHDKLSLELVTKASMKKWKLNEIAQIH